MKAAVRDRYGSPDVIELREVDKPVAVDDEVLVRWSEDRRRIACSGPLGHIVTFRLAAVRSGRKVVFFISKFNKADMEVLRELLETGKVTPVIDRQYELSEIADAFRYMGEGRCRSKIIVTI